MLTEFWKGEKIPQHTCFRKFNSQKWKKKSANPLMLMQKATLSTHSCDVMPGTVPLPWVGHSNSGGQRPDQQDADHQSCQEGDRHRRTQTSLDLRRCPKHTHTHTFTQIFLSTLSNSGCESTFTATFHRGIHDAQTGDCGVPEEIQRQKETQGEWCQEPPKQVLLKSSCWSNPGVIINLPARVNN